MIIPSVITHKHELIKPYLNSAAERVRDVVRGFCDQQGFAYLGRIKEQVSLAEKIETGRYSSWSELDDLFACAIIVPGLSDEPDVLAFLKDMFVQHDCRLRGGARKDPSVFRFDATRFIGKINRDSFPAASDEVLSVKFEVQIRTAFEHAWSVTTHATSYKSEKVDWRHIRLASQLKASVEQLDQLVLGFVESASLISAHSWPRIDSLENIQAVFEREVVEGTIPQEVLPSSWSRFCENFHAMLRASCQKNDDVEKRISTALGLIRDELRASLVFGFPRSISLLQFCQGALAKQGFITKPLHKYHPLITKELLDIYPDSKKLGRGFSFELEAP